MSIMELGELAVRPSDPVGRVIRYGAVAFCATFWLGLAAWMFA